MLPKITKTIQKTFYIYVICIFFAFFFSFCLDVRFFSVIKQYITPSSQGQIVSTYPYFGSLVIHFERPNSTNGTFKFLLKEKNTGKTIYQADHHLHDIYYLSTFPFGFPVIQNSENKTYIFSTTSEELSETKSGVKYEMIYQFDKRALLENGKIMQFLKGKIIQYFEALIYSKNIIFFLTPGLFYFVFSIFKTIFKEFKINTALILQINELFKPTFMILLIAVGYDVFFIPKISDLFIIALCLLWIILIFIYKFSANKSFICALFMFTLSPLLVFSNMEHASVKVGIWVYILIIVGTLQAVVKITTKGSNNNYVMIENIRKIFNVVVVFDKKFGDLIKKKLDSIEYY